MEKRLPRIPRRRFSEFLDDGEWEEKKLGEIGTTFNGLSGKSKEDFGHGEAEFVTYLNVFNNTISKLDQTDRVEIDNRQNEVQYGDIFFTTSSETAEEVGMSSVWLDNRHNVYLNSFCFGYRLGITVNPYYMAYLLRSPSVRKEFQLLAQGISRYNISKIKAMDIGVSIPSLQEQQKIGNFFQRLDKLIDLNKDKLEKLKKSKSAYLSEMFPKEGEHYPRVRFDGFTEPWEEKKLGEILSYEQPTNYIVNSTDYNNNYSIPVLTAGQSFLLGYTNENKGIKFASEKNPVIIFDDFTTSSHYVNFPFKVKSSAMKLLSLVDENNDFYCVYNILKNLNYVPHSHERHWISKFSNFKVSIPNYDEQQKIGNFFKKLDKLIDLNKDKLEKLKKSKSAYLSEMFPKEGELYPRVRFDGFTEPWEEKKLGDVGSVAMNKRIFKYQTSEQGDVPFYKIGTFGKKPDAFISRELFENYKSRYSYPQKGDILLSASGSIGRTVVYEGRDEYFQDSNIVWLKHDGKIDNSFLKQFYKIVKWEGLEGSTIKRLYNKNILETNIKLPSLPEQEKIGDFFKKLDEQINLQEEKIKKLENMKKAYLSEMFV